MRTIKVVKSCPRFWKLKPISAFLLFFITFGFPLISYAQTPVNFKIAFIGDAGTSSNADAVLNLISSEGADVVVHAGDMTYSNSPQAFENNVNSILGANFPYFWSAGNHDSPTWGGSNGFKAFGEARMNRLGIPWTGNLGVSSTFTYNGIYFVASAPDELGVSTTQAGNHIRTSLAANNAPWSIAYWHKNQHLMQLGNKSNEAGWPVYEEARKGGAIIVTAHEHSYSRTHEMSDMQNQGVSSTNNTIVLKKDDPATNSDEGRSFAFVSGLGGKSIRSASGGKENNPWWASTYHRGNGAQYGVLFGEFNYNGDATLARFYFKDIDGTVVDSFFVRTNVETPQVCSTPPSPTNLGSATITQTAAAISWNQVPVVDGYNVRHRISGSTVWTTTNTTATTLNLTGLTANTTYEVQVNSVCSAGTNSAFSSSHSFTTLSPPDTQTPTNPTNLTAANVSFSTADLSWNASTDNIGVTAYQILEGTNVVGTSTTTSFNLTGLSSNTTYSYAVRALDAAGNTSGNSNSVSITTLADTQAPTAPTALAVSNVNVTTLSLSWTASNDNLAVSGYEIFQNGNSIGNSATTSFNVTGLTAQTNYNFFVRASDAAGNMSPNSNSVSATTLAVPPCSGISTIPYNESFESNLGVWTNATDDNINWTRDSGGTPSNGTGPSSGQNGSFYLYTEASGNGNGYPNKVAILNSPCIDLSGTPSSEFQFGYHMNGTSVGTLEVLVSTDGTAFTSLWSKSGSQGNQWNQAAINLSTYGGSVIYLQFKATTGSSWSSDITVDNIKIISTTPDTQAPSTPSALTASNTTDNSTDLSWTASTDDVAVVSYEILQNGVSIGTSVNTTYTATGLAPLTNYSFEVRAADAAGNVSGNSNTVAVTTLATPPCSGISSLPYDESFESNLGVWTNATDDDIQWTRDSGGTPSNNTGPTTGQDGSFYLYTEASGNGNGYPNKVAILNSPCVDLSGIPSAEFQFGYHMQGTSLGSLDVLVSTNGSTFNSVWSKSGSQGNQWNQATIDLSAYSGNVIYIQFKAITGSSWSSDISIDNVKIISTTPDTEAPSAPSVLTTSNTSAVATTLSWTASTDNIGITSYEILQNGTSIGTSSTTNFDVTGLTSQVSYSFAVRAHDAAGNVSGNSNSVTITTPNVIQYTINTSVNGSGTVNGAGTYTQGSTATLTAVPNSGYTFTGWSGDLSGTTNPNSVVMNSSLSVTANFALITNQILTQNTSGGDKIEVNDGQEGSQSFRYDNANYNISKVVLYISKESAVNSSLDFSIGTGVNSGAISGSNRSIQASEITNTSEGSNFMTYEITFNPPLETFNAGTNYYLNFTSSDDKKYFLSYSGGNSYPNGTYYKDRSNDNKDIRFQIHGSAIGARHSIDLKSVNLAISPNPLLQENLDIAFNSFTETSGKLEIINLQGQVVYVQVIEAYRGQNNLSLALSTYIRSGEYLVRLTLDKQSTTTKLIIQK